MDKQKEIELRNEQKQDSNDEWISKNKQDWIDKFEEKKAEYDNKIIKLTTKRNKLISLIKEYETKLNEAKEAKADLVGGSEVSHSDVVSDSRSYSRPSPTATWNLFSEHQPRLRCLDVFVPVSPLQKHKK